MIHEKAGHIDLVVENREQQRGDSVGIGLIHAAPAYEILAASSRPSRAAYRGKHRSWNRSAQTTLGPAAANNSYAVGKPRP